MGFSGIFFNFLIVVVIFVSMAATTSPAASALVLMPGRRSIGKWSHSHHIPQVKGLTFDKVEQVAGDGVKPLNDNDPKAFFSGTQTSSNMDVEEIVYTIDYRGVTTHPTPTPKHPRP